MIFITKLQMQILKFLINEVSKAVSNLLHNSHEFFVILMFLGTL